MEVILDLDFGKTSIPSKKNQYRRGRGKSFYKPDEIIEFEEDALIQIKEKIAKQKIRNLPFRNPVKIEMFFICDSFRADLDNKFTTIQDLLVWAGILTNDNLLIVRKGYFEGIKVKGENKVKIIVNEINEK